MKTIRLNKWITMKMENKIENEFMLAKKIMKKKIERNECVLNLFPDIFFSLLYKIPCEIK